MRELITRSDNLDLASQASAEREPSLLELQKEDLPPLHELIAEHAAMVQEQRRQQREQEINFTGTMYRWSYRARHGKDL